MNPSIGLSDPDRRAVVDILGGLLADEYVDALLEEPW